MAQPHDDAHLLHHLIARAAWRDGARTALVDGDRSMDYAVLQQGVEAFASGLMALGLRRGDRVGIYLDKRFETVIASFGIPAAGGVLVPMNPLLKPEQVAYIARDCDVRILVRDERTAR